MLEELGEHFDQESSNQTDSLLSFSASSGLNKPRMTLASENIKKRDFRQAPQSGGIGVQNLKLRSLCIAAYLRCLFGAIEYAPN
jgi:hypothetical protein